MKNLNSLIFIIFLSTLSCRSQDNAIQSDWASINGHTVFKVSTDFLTQNFGPPNTVEDYFFEMENTMGEKYQYNGLLFYLVDDKVDSFEITNDQYEFTTNNIKVGQHIDALQSLYPNSFSNRRNGGIILPFEDVDYFVSINFNSDDIIEKIVLHDY